MENMTDVSVCVQPPTAENSSTSRASSALANFCEFQPSQASFWQMFESAPEAMIISDQQDCILHVNSLTELRFGYQRKELIGERLEKLISRRSTGIPPDQGDISNGEYSRHLTGAAIQGCGLKKDGSKFPIEMSSTSIETEEVILNTIRDTSERIATEKARRQSDFERTLSGLSAVFINLPPDQVDREITNGLKTLCEALDGDRTTLARTDIITGNFFVTHAWAREGVPEFPRQFIGSMLPWLEEHIFMGEIVNVPRPEVLPAEAFMEREYMESMGEKSSVIVPLRVSGMVIGGLGCDSFKEYQKWDAVMVSRVQDVADVFANALARKQADENLQQAYTEIQQLKDQLQKENAYLREEIKLERPHSEIIGDSKAIQTVLKRAEQVAPTDSVVLILGETGTGKQLIAQTIHEMSSRNKLPMIKINCAALPATLIESELFGREKGAYTGALAREIGRFELADKSTIFLDEIGEIPLDLQPKLLRVLQDGQFERLGSPKTIQVDTRIIAATNRDLKAMVKEGKFREDLFYRLNVFPILIPPLRARAEDIPSLVWHILKDLCKRMGRNVEAVHASTMRDFQKYSWPGNVRELRNVIERNLILHSGTHLRAEIPDVEQGTNRGGCRIDEMERDHFRNILQGTRWRVRGNGGAAELLGLKPTTLESRMKKLGIHRPA